MRFKVLSLFIFLLACFSAQAQHVIDFLTTSEVKAIVKTINIIHNDRVKTDLLTKLAYYHMAINGRKRERKLDSAVFYLKQAEQLAKKTDDQSAKIMVNILYGEGFFLSGKPDSSKNRLLSALNHSKAINSVKLQGIALFHLSKLMLRYKDAEQMLNKSAACFLATKDVKRYQHVQARIQQIYNYTNYLPYRINFRPSDTTGVNKLRKAIKNRNYSEKSLSEKCLDLSSIYMYKKGNGAVNADSMLYFANLAIALANKKESQKISGESGLYKALYYYRRQEFLKIASALVNAQDSVKFIVWCMLGGQYYTRPVKQVEDDIMKDSSVYFYKQALLLARTKSDPYLVKASVDGLIRTATYYANGRKPEKAVSIYKFIQANKSNTGYPSDILLNYKLYRAYAPMATLTEAMKCAVFINNHVTEKSSPMFRFMNYYVQSDIHYWLRNYEQSNVWLERMARDQTLYDDRYATVYDVLDPYFENMRYLHRTEKALELAKKIYRDYPPLSPTENFSYHFTLAKSYFNLKDYNAAEPHFLKSIEAGKSMPENLAHVSSYLAATRFMKGDYAGAKKLISSQLEKPDPTLGYQVSLYNWGAKIDSALNDSESAYRWLLRSQRLSDSIYNKTRDSYARELEYLDNSQKKEMLLITSQNRLALLNKTNKLLLQKVQLQMEAIELNKVKHAADSTSGLLKDKSFQFLQFAQRETRKQTDETVFSKKVFTLFGLLILAGTGVIYVYVSNKRRIAERIKHTNGQLEKMLTEKNWLIKEMHHRVKNNLHMVTSLLDAQASTLKDHALHVVRNSQHKIFAMSLIHQKLYQDEEVRKIDLNEFIIELVAYLKEGFDIKNLVRFNYDMETVSMDVENAVQLSLILDEIISFFIRDSLSEKVRYIEVLLKNEGDGEYHLTIKKTGNMEKSFIETGILPDLTLIDRLAEKIGAQVSIDLEKRTIFMLEGKLNHSQYELAV